MISHETACLLNTSDQEARVEWIRYSVASHFHLCKREDFHEQLEVLALVGDIATKDGRASVHCHVVVDRKDFHGGWSPDGGVYGPL